MCLCFFLRLFALLGVNLNCTFSYPPLFNFRIQFQQNHDIILQNKNNIEILKKKRLFSFHYYDAVASNLFGASMPEWPFNCYDQMTPLSDKSNIMLQTLGPAVTAKMKKNIWKYQKSKIFRKSHLVYFDLYCFMLTICTKSSST